MGTTHGVIKRITPDAEIIDITHGIPPQQVLQGALVLANTLPYMPIGIHVAVVDPGVGSHRKALALRGGDGRLYIGPDNGVLPIAAENLGGIEEVVEIANAEYMLQPVSRTFHGRDIFAPAAAHLARDVDLLGLGPPLDVDELVRLEVPEPVVLSRRLEAAALYIDRFGNVALNLSRSDLERAGIETGALVEVAIGTDRVVAAAARAFADVDDSELVLYEDAYQSIALAVNGGSAAERFSIRVGDRIRIIAFDR